jgi:hypothetical protein
MRRIALVALFFAAPARAEEEWGQPEESTWDPGRRTTARVQNQVEARDRSRADGVYGRLSGDVNVGVRGGAEASHGHFGATGGLSVHYLSMAGAFVSYTDALGEEEAEHARVIAVGVDMRPLFIPRWSFDMQQGPAFFDLALDSLSIALGVFWAALPDGALDDRRGLEASFGIGLPLFGRAEGLWLETRGKLRWADGTGTEPERVSTALMVVIAWQEIFDAPL